MGFFVPVDSGVKLYVEDINPLGKKTIVFLHGWPLSHEQFEYQYNVLPALGYRCIGIDWRGFGKSDRPFEGYSFNRLADDVFAVVNALQLNHFALLGHSTGGAIALRYVARYKGFGVSKLILVASAAPVGFTQETAQSFLELAYNDRPKMMQKVIDGFFFQYITKEFSDWFMNMGMEAASWSTIAIINTLRDETLYEDLSKVHVPTSIIHGIHDKVIPFAQAHELHQGIKHSRIVPFQYSGHGTFWEERDKFNKVLCQFV